MIPRRRPLLRGIPDADLDDRLLRDLRAIRAQNKNLRTQARRLLRAAEQYILAELPQYPDALREMRRLALAANHLMIALYPYAECPECNGEGDRDCPLCHGLWWVDKTTYWEWRKAHAELPEPTTPSILDRT